MNLKSFFRPRKIEIFVRTCYYSEVSAHKKRPLGFSHQRCLENLMETIDQDEMNLTFLLDTARASQKPHFITEQRDFPVITIKEGTEGGSFLRLLDYVLDQNYHKETILYFVEDDYLHRPGWISVLKEAFTLPITSYVTLYDHGDKYFLPQYQNLSSRIFHTPSTHWRTTPSTTNTYAMKFKTLKEHITIHRAFSEGRKITADHEKFCALAEKGATLISPIPGWSTHMDPEALSPCIDWEKVVKRNKEKVKMVLS